MADLQYTLDLQRAAFARQMQGAIRQVQQLDSAINQLNSRAINPGSGPGSSGGFMKKAALGAAFAYATSKVIDFESAVISSLKNAEYFSASLNTLLKGDTAQARALESQLITLAKTTPFSLNEVQSSTKQLLAYGFAAGDITDNIKMLGDVAAGAGQPIGEIAYLYGTLRTQGRAFTQDIRQFLGRGIPIVEILAKNLHKTTAEINEMVSKGKIGFKEIENAFKTMTAEGGQFYQMMAAQADTVGGKISNLEDSWDQLKVNIGKSQTGIISNTVAWASRMVDVMNTFFVEENFKDNATKNVKNKIRPTSMWNPATWSFMGLNNQDIATDERFRAMKGNQTKEFKTAWERDFFINQTQDGEGFRDIGSYGTEARFNEFSSRILDKLNALTELPKEKQGVAAAQFNKDMLNERMTLIKALESRTMSATLAENEFAVIKDAMSRATGLISLSQSKTPATPAGTGKTKEDTIGTGLEEGFARPQNLYITIDRLVGIENLTQNSNMTEAAPEIKEIIARTMLEAVNDINNQMK